MVETENGSVRFRSVATGGGAVNQDADRGRRKGGCLRGSTLGCKASPFLDTPPHLFLSSPSLSSSSTFFLFFFWIFHFIFFLQGDKKVQCLHFLLCFVVFFDYLCSFWREREREGGARVRMIVVSDLLCIFDSLSFLCIFALLCLGCLLHLLLVFLFVTGGPRVPACLFFVFGDMYS